MMRIYQGCTRNVMAKRRLMLEHISDWAIITHCIGGTNTLEAAPLYNIGRWSGWSWSLGRIHTHVISDVPVTQYNLRLIKPFLKTYSDYSVRPNKHPNHLITVGCSQDSLTYVCKCIPLPTFQFAIPSSSICQLLRCCFTSTESVILQSEI